MMAACPGRAWRDAGAGEADVAHGDPGIRKVSGSDPGRGVAGAWLQRGAQLRPLRCGQEENGAAGILGIPDRAPAIRQHGDFDAICLGAARV